MAPEVLEFFLFASCLIISGFYSGSEAAIISISMERARQLIDLGGRRGQALSYFVDNQNRVLTTILVGNNLVNIFAASLTTSIAQRYFQNKAIAISTGITTLLILLFGEIIPKTFARSKSETLAYPVIKILQFNYYLLFPLIVLFTWISQLILGKNAELTARAITKNDIEFMVNKAEQEKTIDSKQLNLLNSILEFPTIKVKDILVPRNQVKFVDGKQGLKSIMKLAHTDQHSRYPVCDGDLDHTMGILHVKSVAFLGDEEKKNFSIEEHIRRPFFVYEHMKIQAVFDHMNRRKIHMAIVKDESGLVVGIITLEDIIEEIVGEIIDEHDDDETTHRKDLESGVVVDGTISLRDLSSEYEIKIPLDDNYSNLMGFLMESLGNQFPKTGQVIIWEGLSFEIMKVHQLEIERVRIRDIDGDKHLFSKTEAQNASKEANSDSDSQKPA